MYMKVFEHGKGRGEGPVDYVIDTKRDGRERSPPQVLRGNPALTKELINSLDTDWKYSSGVLSWNHADKVSVEQENELMNAFENLAFAGLQDDQYNVLWVRHSHAGHHELHFVVPRVELYGGKSFNPCPPNWRLHYDPLRDYYNVKHNWHRPDNPTRRKLPTPEQLDKMKARLAARRKKLSTENVDKFKEDLMEYLVLNLRHGFVHNRDEIIDLIHSLGLELNRKGKDYVTALDQESGIKFRLKHGIFSEGWSAENTDMQELIHETFYAGLTKEEMLAKLQAQIDEITQRRADYNRQRYGNAHKNEMHSALNDVLNIEITSSQNQGSEHKATEVINDRNTIIYQAVTTTDNPRQSSTLESNTAGSDEASTRHHKSEAEDNDFGETTRGIVEVLKGFCASIHGIIRSLPRIARNNRGREIESKEDDNNFTMHL